MRININGARLFFDVEGSKLVVDGPEMREKPSLILLHGAPGLTDHPSFKPRFSALADTAQLIHLDLSGAGRSDPTPDGQYSLDRWADDLVAFCDALEIEKPVVLGISPRTEPVVSRGRWDLAYHGPSPRTPPRPVSHPHPGR